MGKKMGRPLNSGKDGWKSGKLVTYRITPAAIEYIRQQGNRTFLEALVPKDFRETFERFASLNDVSKEDLNEEHTIERPEELKETNTTIDESNVNKENGENENNE